MPMTGIVKKLFQKFKASVVAFSLSRKTSLKVLIFSQWVLTPSPSSLLESLDLILETDTTSDRNYQLFAPTEESDKNDVWTWPPPRTLSWERWWRAKLSQHFAPFSWFDRDGDQDVNGDGDDTRWWQWHNLARNLLRFSTLMMFPREDSTNQGCSRHLNQNQYNKQVRVNISYQRKTFWDFSTEPGRVDPVISAFPEQARDEVFGLGRHRVELLVVKVVLGPEQEFILRSGSLSQSSKIWRF